ncbi:hypothetical protein ACU4GD_27210 [Cupriavidus basilensis]
MATKVAEFVKANAGAKVQVSGFTDTLRRRGSQCRAGQATRPGCGRRAQGCRRA